MDQFDKATELEELARDRALAYQRSKTAHGAAFEQCEDCGVAIPAARRLVVAGVKTCIDCQIFNEKQGKLYAAR